MDEKDSKDGKDSKKSFGASLAKFGVTGIIYVFFFRPALHPDDVQPEGSLFLLGIALLCLIGGIGMKRGWWT